MNVKNYFVYHFKLTRNFYGMLGRDNKRIQVRESINGNTKISLGLQMAQQDVSSYLNQGDSDADASEDY